MRRTLPPCVFLAVNQVPATACCRLFLGLHKLYAHVDGVYPDHRNINHYDGTHLLGPADLHESRQQCPRGLGSGFSEHTVWKTAPPCRTCPFASPTASSFPPGPNANEITPAERPSRLPMSLLSFKKSNTCSTERVLWGFQLLRHSMYAACPNLDGLLSSDY